MRSTKRWLTDRDLRPVGRGPNGRPTCRWCGEEVPRPRRSWCSDVCVHEYLIRSSSEYVRRKVFERDQGVCALCGIDTEWLRKELYLIRKTNQVAVRSNRWSMYRGPGMSLWEEWERGIGGWPVAQSLWAADHIVPVAEGGGLCGLEGYRTLCYRCHKRETAALAARMAERRQRERFGDA